MEISMVRRCSLRNENTRRIASSKLQDLSSIRLLVSLRNRKSDNAIEGADWKYISEDISKMFYLFFLQVIFLSPEMYRYQIDYVTIEQSRFMWSTESEAFKDATCRFCFLISLKFYCRLDCFEFDLVRELVVIESAFYTI